MEKTTKLLRSDYNYLAGQAEIAVECGISHEKEIEKILGATACVGITSSTPGSGENVVVGKVNFKILVLGADGVRTLDYFSDFTAKIKGDFTPTMKTVARAYVIDVTANLKDGSVSAQATARIDAYALALSETQALEDIECASVKRGTVWTNTFLAECSSSVDLYDDVDAGSVKNVTFMDASSIVTAVTCEENVVKVDGEAVINLTYENDKGIFTHVFNIPFSEEIEAVGSCADHCVASATADVENVKIVLGGTEENTEIRPEITLTVTATVWKKLEEEVLLDAFCTDREISLSSIEKDCYSLSRCLSFEEKTNGQATLRGDAPLISRVITTCGGRNTLTNIGASNGEILVEGVIGATVLYLDSSEGINALQIELPYSTSLTSDCVNENDVLTAESCVVDISSIAKRENEVEISCKLKFMICVNKREKMRVITSFKEGKEKTVRRYPISVRFGEPGADLWNTARALNVSPEALVESNPELTFPLAGGEKIVEYRRLECE